MSSETPNRDPLSRLEEQINEYKQQLQGGCKWLVFPQWLEEEYLVYRNQQFLATAKVTLLIGILFYVVMGAFDHTLGRRYGNLILTIRTVVAFVLIVGLFISLNHDTLKNKVIEIAGVGIFVVSSSVLAFIHIIDEPYSYIYHFGLIPLQVYVLIVYRSSFRATLVVSTLLLSSFIIFSELNDFQPSVKVIDDLVDFVRPSFVIFWLVMIGMGLFLTYYLELSSRLDFVKSRLLELDGERMSLLTDKLHLLSTTDSLTELANRRHLESCLDAEWRRAKRTAKELAVIMIDVDNFKQFNDRYGHQAGDDCLVKVSRVFKNNAQRSGEVAGRYGGEEFIIVIPNANEEQAMVIAERIRKQVEALEIPSAARIHPYVTVSVGVAVVMPNDRITPDQLISLADSCLYKAKEKGRNQVCAPPEFY